MTAEFSLDLTAVVSTWPSVAKENVKQLGDGWDLAQDMAELHGRALQRMSKDVGHEPDRQDEGLLLLGIHGLNLFISAMGLVARGQFDVVSHLLRALFDCESLAFAVGSRPELAKKFFAGKLRAAEGRKLVVETVRPTEPELAEFINNRYMDEFDAANDVSHVNLTHLDKLVERVGELLTPVVGGRADENLARRMCGGALEHEHWHLAWLRAFRAERLGQDWVDELNAMTPRFRGWMRAVFGATGSNGPA